MPPRTYEPPQLDKAPRAINPQQTSRELKDDSEVTIIFRGGPPVIDMFDSRDYYIPPKPEGVDREAYRQTFCQAEHFTIRYDVAKHLQTRAIVPGTRDRADYRKAASQIGIIGIDRPQFCEPFTPEQLEHFGGTYKEGLALPPEERVYENVADVNRRSLAQRGVDLDRQVANAAAAEHEPASEGGAGVRSAQAGEAAAVASGRDTTKFSETKVGKVKFKDEPKA